MENMKYSEIVKNNRLNLDSVKDQKPLRIKILSNIVAKQIEAPLTFILLESNIFPLIEFGNYDNIVQDSRDCGNEKVVIVHYDLMNILSKRLKFIEDYSEAELNELHDFILTEIDFIIENLSSVPLIIFNSFSSSAVYINSIKMSKADNLSQRLNQHLYSKQTNSLYILDVNKIISNIGVRAAFNYKLYYLAKTLYSVAFWKEYAHPVSLLINQISGYGKKAIIFDCDNTLWRGILGEDGFNGIDMSSQSSVGKIFSEVQQIAVWLSRNGVIVGLCSKNNPEDIDKVFNDHSDIILTFEDVVAKRINWQNKADNIREIASELNIGLDSILFVDDSSFEINLIKEQLPDVNTLQVPREIDQYPQRLLTFINANLYLSDNNEDREKVKQYKAQAERTKEYASHGSIESYLSSINMRLLIKEDDQSQIDRITQLTQKTNQFNLTTKRYTEKQIELKSSE
jgi:FkbH-like protein